MFSAGADKPYRFATGNQFKKDILLNNEFSLIKQINKCSLLENRNNI